MTDAPDYHHMIKGQEVNLNVLDPALHRVYVALGWDVQEQPDKDAPPVDIDASAFLLNRDGRVRHDTDFIFYNNLSTEGGAIKHLGDSVTGAGEGDDERIEVQIENMPFDIDRIALAVTIHNAEERRHSFGLVKNAYIRIVNMDTEQELARFDLSEDATEYNAIHFGDLVREGANWKFRAIGSGSNGGLYRVAREFGVNVAAN